MGWFVPTVVTGQAQSGPMPGSRARSALDAEVQNRLTLHLGAAQTRDRAVPALWHRPGTESAVPWVFFSSNPSLALNQQISTLPSSGSFSFGAANPLAPGNILSWEGPTRIILQQLPDRNSLKQQPKTKPKTKKPNNKPFEKRLSPRFCSSPVMSRMDLAHAPHNPFRITRFQFHPLCTNSL